MRSLRANVVTSAHCCIGLVDLFTWFAPLLWFVLQPPVKASPLIVVPNKLFMSNSSDEQQQQQGNGQSQNGSNRASLNNAQANSSHSISPEVEEQFHGQPPVVFRNGCGIEDMEAFWEQAQKIQTDNHQLSERVSSLTREHNTLRTDYNTLLSENERILQRQMEDRHQIDTLLNEFHYWILCFAFFIPPLSILATARNNGLSFPVTVLSALAATIFCAFLWIPGILFALAFYFGLRKNAKKE
ncbi:hypothetical protein niasHT_037767 [Heterodera trifolii]|uniref:Uncharacterized protein n=1 Tax=Heterodera trifolii TaxID=157864 RepID=A0ABD2J7Q6_9BILA